MQVNSMRFTHLLNNFPQEITQSISFREIFSRIEESNNQTTQHQQQKITEIFSNMRSKNDRTNQLFVTYQIYKILLKQEKNDEDPFFSGVKDFSLQIERIFVDSGIFPVFLELMKKDFRSELFNPKNSPSIAENSNSSDSKKQVSVITPMMISDFSPCIHYFSIISVGILCSPSKVMQENSISRLDGLSFSLFPLKTI